MKAKKIVPGSNIVPYWECAKCGEIVRDHRIGMIFKKDYGYNYCPECGTKQEYKEDVEANRISNKYNVSRNHAECYICNFKDDYICVKHNGGCSSINECEGIYRGENK